MYLLLDEVFTQIPAIGRNADLSNLALGRFAD